MSTNRNNKSTKQSQSGSPATPEKAASSLRKSIESSWKDVEGTVADRRVLPDRRAGRPGAEAGEADTGLERRRGPGRRRSDAMRSAEEGEMSKEQFLFLMAIDAFKRVNTVTYPTWSDVLEILRRLGYRKVQPSQINLPNAEDWTERPDAPISIETVSPHSRCSDVDAEADVDGFETMGDEGDAFEEAA